MIYYFVLCVAVLFGIILCISYYEVHHFVLKRYQFVDTGIEETVKIIYISDLHGNRFGKKNERLVEAIRNEKPDCIIIGGDLIVGKGNRVITETALEFLKEIQDICLVIYSFGNHETRVREDEHFLQYLREIKKMHIHLLNNELLTCRLKGTEFQFYGLELEKDCYKDRKKFCLSEKDIFQDTKEKSIRVLIAHTPNYFEKYVEWKPDFVYSGHNHGGIVRLPFIRGVISTDYHFFPRYSYGLYKKDNTTMIVSAGAGTHTIHFRLFNPSELVAVSIDKK